MASVPVTRTKNLYQNKLDIPSQLLQTLKQHSIPHLIRSRTESGPAFLPYNVRISVFPLLITYPSDISQIQALVRCVAPLALKITVRSGGHSYAAHSLGGGRDDVVVIDMRAWQNVTLSKTEQDGGCEATVGAGIRLGNLAAALYQLGQRGLPHGTCPLVGLGGHALYGGFGLSSRMWGLTLDNILSVSGVLADGGSFAASATQNCDLFWALRGAGPSFAIVTEMTLRTYLAPECVIVWEFIWTFPLIAGPEPPAKAFIKAQEFAVGDGPVRELGFGVKLGKNGFFKLYGTFFGQKAQFENILEQLGSEIDQIWNGAVQSTNSLNSAYKTRNVYEMGYMEALNYLAEGIELESNITVPKSKDLEVEMNKVDDINVSAFMKSLGPGARDCFFARSLVQPEAVKLTHQAVSNMLEYLYTTGESTPNDWFIITNLYGGGPLHRNSVITSPTTPLPLHPASTSCYSHRECLFVFQFYASTTQNQSAGAGVISHSLTDLVNGMVQALQNSMPCIANWGQYAPYVEPTRNREAAEKAYFDNSGSLKRLKQLKARWDPHDTFWCEIGVIPESTS